jgi:hypothetical protein
MKFKLKIVALSTLSLIGLTLLASDLFKTASLGIKNLSFIQKPQSQTADVLDANLQSGETIDSVLTQIDGDIQTLPNSPNGSDLGTATLTLSPVNSGTPFNSSTGSSIWAVFPHTLENKGSNNLTFSIHYSGTTVATYVGVSGLDAPFSFAGGSYPGTGGTCGISISADCSIVLTFTPRGEIGILGGSRGNISQTYESNFALQYIVLNSSNSSKIINTNSSLLAAQALSYIPTADITLPSNEDMGTVALGESITEGLAVIVRKNRPETGYGNTSNASMTINNPDNSFTISPAKDTGCDLKNKTIGYVCTFNITYTPTQVGNNSEDISFNYCNGSFSGNICDGTQKTVTTHITASASAKPPLAVDPSNNLLIVYNSAVPESVKIKDYYIKNRPGFSNANVISVYDPFSTSCDLTTSVVSPDCPTIFNSVAELASADAYKNDIRKPILDWINAHPEKDIRTIVLLRGIPTRVAYSSSIASIITDYPDYFPQESTSLSNDLAQVANDPSCQKSEFFPIRNGQQLGLGAGPAHAPTLGSGCIKPTAPTISGYFTPQGYPGTLALITVLDMGSSDATLAYIDKLATTSSKMAHPNIVLSGTDAGIAGNTYDFEDIRLNQFSDAVAINSKNSVLSVNPNASVIYHDDRIGANWINPSAKDLYTSDVNNVSNILGYMTWGSNGGRGGCYAFHDSDPNCSHGLEMNFSGKSSWYIITSLDSFNGAWDTYQGSYRTWFFPNAFGGANYQNTPVGAVTTVDEPLLSGKNSPEFFSCWEQGRLFVDCAWISRNSSTMMAVGDPWVIK